MISNGTGLPVFCWITVNRVRRTTRRHLRTSEPRRESDIYEGAGRRYVVSSRQEIDVGADKRRAIFIDDELGLRASLVPLLTA